MKLTVLSSETEKLFWNYVNVDFCDYYFFIYDWLLQKDRTQVFLALKDDAVVGAMLIYEGSIVQLRGEPKAVGFLLENLKLKNIELMALLDCEKEVLDKFPNYKQKAITLMTLKAGEEKPSSTFEPQRLTSADADEVAQLMKESYPEMWSSITAKNVKELFGSDLALWLGIKFDSQLVAFGYAMLTPQVSHVMWIATRKEHRNRSCATSIVSALTKECLNKASTAIIYVEDNNFAAKTVYAKVGFKPYKTYLLLKTEN